jgi:hypothetical protein
MPLPFAARRKTAPALPSIIALSLASGGGVMPGFGREVVHIECGRVGLEPGEGARMVEKIDRQTLVMHRVARRGGDVAGAVLVGRVKYGLFRARAVAVVDLEVDAVLGRRSDHAIESIGDRGRNKLALAGDHGPVRRRRRVRSAPPLPR